VESELGGKPELRDLSGRGLREMIRLAKSDSQLWSEITDSNVENVRAALSAMERNLAELRDGLSTPAFQRLFEQGRKLDPDADTSGAEDTDPPNFG
jgi:prephenate dehydrogenase